jgi:hypothetical protein
MMYRDTFKEASIEEINTAELRSDFYVNENVKRPEPRGGEKKYFRSEMSE